MIYINDKLIILGIIYLRQFLIPSSIKCQCDDVHEFFKIKSGPIIQVLSSYNHFLNNQKEPTLISYDS